jgi:3-oxoisoapionate decarboxylase
MTTRRDVLRRSVLGAAACLAAKEGGGSSPSPRTTLGLVTYCCLLRQQAEKRHDAKADLLDPLAFFEHCRQLGAGGMQVALGIRETDYTTTLRRRVERYGMFLEGSVDPPRNRADSERFDAQLRTAAAANVRAVRTVLFPGRRYEVFASADEFHRAAEHARQSLELAAPVAAKHRVRVAVENHKDQRADELVDTLRGLASPWIGACVDVGNNLALLEDPLETVQTLAPWAFCVHLKDHAVQGCDEGFLLADVPLGEGTLDLRDIVTAIRKAQPDAAFCLEVITRDPLRVPCLTDNYWASMPETSSRTLGRELARTLRNVRARRAAKLPYPSRLSADEQVAMEDRHVASSLHYARTQLGMVLNHTG